MSAAEDFDLAEPPALTGSGLLRVLAGEDLRHAFARRFNMGPAETRILSLLTMRAPFSLSKAALRGFLASLDGLHLSASGLDQAQRNIASALWRAGCVGEVLHAVPGGWRICGNGQAMLISLIEGPTADAARRVEGRA